MAHILHGVVFTCYKNNSVQEQQSQNCDQVHLLNKLSVLQFVVELLQRKKWRWLQDNFLQFSVKTYVVDAHL